MSLLNTFQECFQNQDDQKCRLIVGNDQLELSLVIRQVHNDLEQSPGRRPLIRRYFDCNKGNWGRHFIGMDAFIVVQPRYQMSFYGQSRTLFVYFRPFLITISIQFEKSIDGVLGIRTWAAGWQAQTKPQSYGGHLTKCLCQSIIQ